MNLLIPSMYSIFTVIATILSLLLVLYTILAWGMSKSAKSTKKLTPPQAKGAWPIIGHLHMLASSTTLLHKALGAMANEYGPIFTLKLGRERVVLVSSRELAKECFTRNDLALSSRPKLLASKHLGFNYAMLGFTPYGPYWREVRKLITLHLLSAYRLEQLEPVRAAEVAGFVKGLYKTWSESGVGRVLVDLKEGFLELTLDIIVRMVVGKRYHNRLAGPVTKEEEEEGRRWQMALEKVFHLFGIFVVGDFIPWLKWLDLGGHEKAMKKVHRELDTVLQKLIDEHKESRTREGKSKQELDFMDVMLSLLDGKNLGGYDSDHVNKATVFNLIAGGSDTTATTLIWAMSLLLNNRKAMKRAQDELDKEIGKNRKVVELDIPKLVYLQAIVKETLRLYPPSPLSAQHLVVEDCTIGGYHIERGSRIVVNMSKIQRDPSVWTNPTEFLPERFLTTHRNIDVKGQHFELIPFSAGRRGCPGSSFALHVVHLSLASLLQAFEFSTPDDNAPLDMTESSGLSNMKVGPLQVFISPRLPHHVYE